jgi:GNAT superfamily N-acetyltransferase
MAFIRMAELRDAAAIAHVHVQSWLTTYKGIVPQEYLASLNEAERTSSWEDWLARDIIVAVAEIDGEIVGFAGGGPIREPLEPYDAELYTLYLLEDEQGRGLGKGLLCVVAHALPGGRLQEHARLGAQTESRSSFLPKGWRSTFTRQTNRNWWCFPI